MNNIQKVIGIIAVFIMPILHGQDECNDDICLSFDSIDATLGTLDVMYTSSVEISGFQMNLEGVQIVSVSSSLDNISFNESSGFILGIDLTDNPLPSGEGILCSVTFIPKPEEQTTCLSNLLFGGSGGIEYTVTSGECAIIDPCNHDCADVCSGTAFEDACGVCSGGTTDHVADSDIDCTGECYGSAIIDDCGICSSEELGIEFNETLGCDNVCDSGAIIDDCGTCTGGTTGLEYNVDQDCNGDCSGAAFLDDCFVCSEGNSGHVENSDIDQCGVCFGDDSSCSGCMDPMGLNYDSEAILEDGSCQYIADIFVTPSGSDTYGDGTPGAPFRTIQAGLDASDNGDSILVMPGTYYESVELPDKEVTLFSDGGAENTFIDNGPGIFGDGSDGDLIVGSGETYYTDEVRTTVVGSNLAGQNTITVDDATGFSVGDEILIMTMGDVEEVEENNDTGQWETRRISAISGSTLTLDIDLTNTYSTEFSGTFEGVYKTSNDSYYSTWNSNQTFGYRFVLYEKIKITKLKRAYGSKWSIWHEDGTLIHSQEVSGSQVNWTEFDPDSEIILDPGTYHIGIYNSSHGYYRRGWNAGGDYYQSFRHGVVERACYTGGGWFPSTMDLV